MKRNLYALLKCLACVFLIMPAYSQGEKSDGEIKVQVANVGIDSVYQKVMSSLSEDQKIDLRNSQRAWIVWRDAEAKFIASFNLIGGASQREDYFNAQIRLINQRAEYLEKYLVENTDASYSATKKRNVIDRKDDDSSSKASSKSAKAISQMDSLKYIGSWFMEYAKGHSKVSKFVNDGKFPIKAFRGSFTVMNDFGEEEDSSELVFDSKSVFMTSKGRVQNHVIMPGEMIYLHLDPFGDQWWHDNNIIMTEVNNGLEKNNQPKFKNELDLPNMADGKKLKFRFDRVVKLDR